MSQLTLGVRVSERILLSIDDLNTAERLGLDAEGLFSEPRLYLDRFGEYKVPFGVAVKVAKPCCERCCATCKQRKRSCGGSSSPGTSTRFGASSTGERRVSRPSYGVGTPIFRVPDPNPAVVRVTRTSVCMSHRPTFLGMA